MERRLAAVLIGDVVGYSGLSQIDEEGTRARFQADLKEVFEPNIASYHGRLIKTMGDGVLVEFPSVVDALRCAVEVQQAKAKRNVAASAVQRLQFRIGINLGDIIVEGEDIHGDGVNIADRIQTLAEPGGIAISGTVYDHVKTKLPVGYTSLGEQKLKSIAAPIRAYRVVMDPAAVGNTTGLRHKLRLWRGMASAAAVVLVVVAALAVAWWRLWPPGIEAGPTDGRASVAVDPSLVVLPFENLSDDREQGYLADGITEDLTTELARTPGLFVISRTAAFSYKGKEVPPTELAAELGIRYILKGSVRRIGEDLRINAQLIDASSSGHMWAQRFDGAWSEVFALQDKVIAEVSGALKLRLVTGPKEAAGVGGTNVPAAYDAYLKALEHLRLNTPKDFAQAASLYEQAVKIDPDFGRAWADYAWLYFTCWDVAECEAALGVAHKDMLPKVYILLEEAKKHPSTSYYRTLASVLKQARDSDAAISAIESAIALDPSDLYSYEQMSEAMTFNGRAADAEKYLSAAARVDPESTNWRLYLAGIAYFGMDRFEDAVASLEKIDRQKGDYWARFLSRYFLASAYSHLGRLDKATAYNNSIESEIERRGETTSTVLLAQSYFPFKQAADRERLLGGLRKAGMLELPSGFDARSKDRLSGDEIRSLIFGHEISGLTASGEEYVRVTAADGATQVTIGSDRPENVISVIEGDAMCAWSNRWGGTCGAILRNPEGTFEDRNQYHFVRAYDRREFSVVK